jgi:hypothetical protein
LKFVFPAFVLTAIVITEIVITRIVRFHGPSSALLAITVVYGDDGRLVETCSWQGGSPCQCHAAETYRGQHILEDM